MKVADPTHATEKSARSASERNQPRRTQAERSEEMRKRLADAAYQVIAKRGHSGLRMAAVAEQAGVSQGALLHHFPDKDSVTLAAIRHALAIAHEEAEKKLSRTTDTVDELLDIMLDDFRSFFLGDQFWVALGVTLDASTTPKMRPRIQEIVAELRKPIYDEWTQRFIELDHNEDRANEIVRTAAALVSGSAIRTLWAERDEITQAIELRWRQSVIDEHQALQTHSNENS
ncbi:hypothetical protein A8B75_01260 [Sphingomonadales bacterium EhC05]|nr:hypothetical protein A8B75_01260 [Sphingomonadales bacterium EhC05]